MVEAIPGRPFGDNFQDMLSVEGDMKRRFGQVLVFLVRL